MPSGSFYYLSPLSPGGSWERSDTVSGMPCGTWLRLIELTDTKWILRAQPAGQMNASLTGLKRDHCVDTRPDPGQRRMVKPLLMEHYTFSTSALNKTTVTVKRIQSISQRRKKEALGNVSCPCFTSKPDGLCCVSQSRLSTLAFLCFCNCNGATLVPTTVNTQFYIHSKKINYLMYPNVL